MLLRSCAWGETQSNGLPSWCSPESVPMLVLRPVAGHRGDTGAAHGTWGASRGHRPVEDATVCLAKRMVSLLVCGHRKSLVPCDSRLPNISLGGM